MKKEKGLPVKPCSGLQWKFSLKKDKIKRSQVQKQLSVIKKSLNLAPEDKLIAFSGETKEGKDELWAEIERVIGYEEPAKE